MADLLGFAYKVIVIGAIVAAVIAMVAAGAAIVMAVKTPAQGMNGNLTTGRQDSPSSPWYSPLTMIKPLVATLGWTDSGFEPWTVLITLATAIPSFVVAALTVRWLIRAAK